MSASREKTALDDYDVVADVGKLTGVMKSFDVTSDNTLNIDLAFVSALPYVSGIEILPSDASPTLPGDIDGNGEVDFGDFLVLSNSFGEDVAPGTVGDIDGNGSVAFADFLILSNNFGKSVARAEPAASVAVDHLWASRQSASAADDAEEWADELADSLQLVSSE